MTQSHAEDAMTDANGVPLVEILDLPGFIHCRGTLFPRSVINSLGERPGMEEMARGVEALLQTAQILMYIANFPVKIERMPIFGIPSVVLTASGVAYVADDLFTAVGHAMKNDPMWQKFMAGTDNLTTIPAAPIDVTGP